MTQTMRKILFRAGQSKCRPACAQAIMLSRNVFVTGIFGKGEAFRNSAESIPCPTSDGPAGPKATKAVLRTRFADRLPRRLATGKKKKKKKKKRAGCRFVAFQKAPLGARKKSGKARKTAVDIRLAGRTATHGLGRNRICGGYYIY